MLPLRLAPLCLEATDCELVLRCLERVLLRTFLISPFVPTHATPMGSLELQKPDADYHT
jgi:hypothetical protein